MAELPRLYDDLAHCWVCPVCDQHITDKHELTIEVCAIEADGCSDCEPAHRYHLACFPAPEVTHLALQDRAQ